MRECELSKREERDKSNRVILQERRIRSKERVRRRVTESGKEDEEKGKTKYYGTARLYRSLVSHSTSILLYSPFFISNHFII